jgi:uncharacterized protein
MKDWMDPISIEDLPRQVPLFMVRGAILLPKAYLPLPIFNVAHLTMMSDCMTSHKFVGLIQPSIRGQGELDFENFDLFEIGCLAKISDIVENAEGRLVAELEGIVRFRLIDHQESENGYPIATVDYTPYASDLIEEIDFHMDRPRLLRALKPYFERLDIAPNWEEIDQTSNHRLLTVLSMACPLPPSEKQALLETESVQEQSKMITTLLEMAALDGGITDPITYH